MAVKNWTEEEIDFVKRNYLDHTAKEMAEGLEGRTDRAISWMMQKLGLQKQPKVIKPENENYKICSKCKQEKPKSEFHKANDKKDGLKSWCKACSHIARAETYQKTLMKRLQPSDIEKKQQKKKRNVVERNQNDLINIIIELSGKIQQVCKVCGEAKLGIDFKFSKAKLEREKTCISCKSKKNEQKIINKILKGEDW